MIDSFSGSLTTERKFSSQYIKGVYKIKGSKKFTRKVCYFYLVLNFRNKNYFPYFYSIIYYVKSSYQPCFSHNFFSISHSIFQVSSYTFPSNLDYFLCIKSSPIHFRKYLSATWKCLNPPVFFENPDWAAVSSCSSYLELKYTFLIALQYLLILILTLPWKKTINLSK